MVSCMKRFFPVQQANNSVTCLTRLLSFYRQWKWLIILAALLIGLFQAQHPYTTLAIKSEVKRLSKHWYFFDTGTTNVTIQTNADNENDDATILGDLQEKSNVQCTSESCVVSEEDQEQRHGV